jgi:hypothetical protein
MEAIRIWKCQRGDIIDFRLSEKSPKQLRGVIVNRIGSRLLSVTTEKEAFEIIQSGDIELIDNLNNFKISVPCIDNIISRAAAGQ